MKVLTQMRLIHWHYFTQETIPFAQINYLTGRNASGKSTILDAMQLVLYGDTSGTYFNKAANGKSARTLPSYLLGELGEDEESGIRYLRNGRFTSYIALEFLDDKKGTYFTAGCVFDIYAANDIQRLFFTYDGPFPDHGFSPQRQPVDIPTLRLFLNGQYKNHHTTTAVGRDFALHLRGKLGGLRDRFVPLMKKAVSFDPDVKIQAFISDFVCDTQQAVDVSQMQENIRSYKQLEAEADHLQARLTLLEHIDKGFGLHQKSVDEVQIYEYLLKRADLTLAQERLQSSQSQRDTLLTKNQALCEEIAGEEHRKEELQGQRDDLHIQLESNQVAQAIKTLDAQIKENQDLISIRKQVFAQSHARLSDGLTQWQSRVGRIGAVKKLPSSDFDPLLWSRMEDIVDLGTQFTETLPTPTALSYGNVVGIGEAGFTRWSQQAKGLSNQAIGLCVSLEGNQNQLTQRKGTLEVEQATLRKGMYQFPSDVLALQQAIQSRLQRNGQVGEVTIVAQGAEIRSERWRNVIEGYLHTQKFYLIVAPEFFSTALQVYDAVKKEKQIYGTGVVDVAKMAHKNPVAWAGSLAEEIETENPLVRTFLDYTLGRVMKCDRVTDLRKHNTAITDEGMVYRNFVASALNPKRWEKPAIGQGAIARRLASVEQELVETSGQIIAHEALGDLLTSLSSLPTLSEMEIAHSVQSAKEMEGVPALEADLVQLKKSRAKVDESAIYALRAHIEVIASNLRQMEIALLAHRDMLSTQREQLRVCEDETIPREEAIVAEREIVLTAFDSVWVAEISALRYQRELNSRGCAKRIAEAFPRELSRAQNAASNHWIHVVKLREDYNRQYKMGLNVNASDNSAFEEIWYELSENKLPDYLARINDTKARAFEQFQEDFLSRLEHNIKDAQLQIDGLNQALKGNDFGEDSYRFVVSSRPDYKRYYDMIVDPMKLEGGYNLFSAQFNNKYQDEITELFALITNEGGGGDSADYEKRVREFTDYRTYLTFDLEVTNTQGHRQRLSKSMQKKSGGETQTPFYIAVLASFAQLYRIGRDKTDKSARLIVFDEAFSKMDGQRVAQSVALLRKFGFQAILSSPSDKANDIIPYVDRSICVLREGDVTCVHTFDIDSTEDGGCDATQ